MAHIFIFFGVKLQNTRLFSFYSYLWFDALAFLAAAAKQALLAEENEKRKK